MGARHSLATVLPGAPDWGELVARMARGDTETLAALYDATAPAVYGLTVRILGDPGAAEEVAGGTFVQAWRQSAGYDPARGGPLAWLLVLARSRAIDRLRATAAARGRGEPLTEAVRMASDAPGPEESVAVAERRRLVAAALARLGPAQRQVIELAYFRGLSHGEVAAVLGQPFGTVKTRIRLGMLALRRALGGEGRESL